MSTIVAISVITFKEGVRHRAIYGVVVMAILLLFFSVLTSGLFMRDGFKILIDISLAAVSLGGLLVPFFLAIELLARDIETRTIYTILAKSVSRTEYIIGKYIGFSLLTAVIICIFTLTTFLGIWIVSEIYPAHFLEYYSPTALVQGVLAIYMGLLVLNSTVVLWCSLTTSSFLATLLTLSTYVIGHSTEDMVRFISAKISGVAISPIIERVVTIAMYVFPNLSAFDLKQQAAYGMVIPNSQILYLCTYMIGYGSVMLILATLVLSRRNLP